MNNSTPQADAVVIGAGVIGCALAWRLAQGGQRVIVVERGDIGQEASWAAGGMLAPLAEADVADDFFHLCVQSRAMYADFAHELRAAADIDIEYRSEGTLYLALTADDEEELERRWQWQHAAGLNVKKLNAACVRKLEPALNEKLRWALKFPDDHQIDNRRLLKALERAARKAGVIFQTRTEATAIAIAGSSVKGVLTAHGFITTSTVVAAAGSWTNYLSLGPQQLAPPFRIEPVRGQMAALAMPTPALEHVVYSRRAYLVPRLSGYLIAGSTTEDAGYDKRTTAGGLVTILHNALEIAPVLSGQTIVETWAGLRPKAADGWPVLGEDEAVRGLIYATGHYRNGILLTPITAQIISELILRGAASTHLPAFSPQRFD